MQIERYDYTDENNYGQVHFTCEGGYVIWYPAGKHYTIFMDPYGPIKSYDSDEEPTINTIERVFLNCVENF